jgi:uncharacterized protein YndB with AHSA1/START domain
MAVRIDVPASSDRELVLARTMDASREKLYRCWTETALAKQWFAPRPWTTPNAEFDVRVGGGNLIVLRSPEGQEFPYRGVYLDVVKNERLVYTDAFTKAWEPSEKAHMVVTITFDPQGEKTRYVARVQHWSVADRVAHEQMGFHEGWGLCADQLEALAKTLP